MSFRRRMMKHQADAVDRRARHGDAFSLRPPEVDPAVSRRAVPAAGLRLFRGDDNALAQVCGGALRSASRPGAFQPSSLVRRMVITCRIEKAGSVEGGSVRRGAHAGFQTFGCGRQPDPPVGTHA